LPVAWQLYLPETWAEDAARRKRAKVPETIGFQTKPEIALGQIDSALAEGIAPGVVLADAGYGNSSAFRDGLAQLGLVFVVGVIGTTTVWPQGITPIVPTGTGRGWPPRRLRRGGDDAPASILRRMADCLEEAGVMRRPAIGSVLRERPGDSNSAKEIVPVTSEIAVPICRSNEDWRVFVGTPAQYSKLANAPTGPSAAIARRAPGYALTALQGHWPEF
jgi:hypothetical protein